MKPRVALLVVAAVVAACLAGTAGAADAGAALTAKSVKKIAAKVVTNAAPKLSVAHARTADSATTAATAANADKLDNLDSGDLTTSVRRYALPTQVSSQSHTFSLTGLGPGTYLVTYNVMAIPAASVYCQVLPSLSNAGARVAVAHSTPLGVASTATGSAVFTAGSQPVFQCQSVSNFTLLEGEIDLTRVDTVTPLVAAEVS